MLSTLVLAATLVYKVGLPEAVYPPYSFPKDDPRPGIYLQILGEALAKDGALYEPVYAPTARILALFEKGQIDIELGINPAWRTDQKEISVYSRAFTKIVDVALRRASERPWAKPGTPIRVGAVGSYRYPKLEDDFKAGRMKREDGDNEPQLLALLHRKRIDLAIVGKMPALHLMKVNIEYRFEVDREIDSLPVMFRVHKAKKDLVPRLDKALDAMLKAGAVDRILAEHQ